MSNHNPHGHLSQPNSSWNPLQIPSFIPRQPQLAHMSNERSLSRSPLTWHTPTPPEAIYNFLSANHKTLELNPLIPPFARDPNHFGSVDLTLQSAKHNSPLALESNQSNSNSFRNTQKYEISNIVKNLEMDKSNNIEIGDKTELPISGCLFVKDTKQINEDFAKNKAKITETEDLIQQKPVELVKENHHYNNINSGSASPKNFRGGAPNSGTSLSPSSIQNINANLTPSPIKKAPAAIVHYESVTSENSSAATSNEDSVDSNLSKNKRKRKQGKTNKVLANCNNDASMTLTELESRNKLLSNLTNSVKKSNIVDGGSDLTKSTVECNDSKSISSNVSDKTVIANPIVKEQTIKDIKEHVELPKIDLLKNVNDVKSKEFIDGNTLQSPTNKNHRRRKLDSDDVETIDKIAEMLASSDIPESVLAQKLTESTMSNNPSLENQNKVNEISNANLQKQLTSPTNSCSTIGNPELPNKASFEEVENRMEQMFAGIEDEMIPVNNQPVSYVLKNTISEIQPGTVSNNLNAVGTDGKKLENKLNLGAEEQQQIADKQIHSSKNLVVPTKKKKKTMKKSLKSKGKTVKTKPKLIPFKPKNKEEQIVPDNKYKSPYIQLKLDGSTCVINTPLAEDDSEKQNKLKKPIFNHNKLERNKIRGLHVSTLSNKYDADTTDTSWLCVFCKKGPHKFGLGDLFGPYIVSTECEDFEICNNLLHNDEFQSNRIKAEMYKKNIHSYPVVPATYSRNIIPPPHNSTTDRKRKIIMDSGEALNMNNLQISREIFSGMIKVSETSYEVWVHEDCIVWTSGIYLIGSKLIGLEESVWGSTRNKCSVCSLNGAMLCCLQRDCKEMAHLCCAKSRSWTLSENNFKTFCQNHSILV